MKPASQFLVQRSPLFLYFLPYFRSFLENLCNKHAGICGTRLYTGSLALFAKKIHKNLIISDAIIKESFSDKVGDRYSAKYKV